MQNCSTSLLGDPTENGIISQNEYAAYLYTLCPSCYSEKEFSALPTTLQLDFMYAVCDSDPDLEKCTEELMTQLAQDKVFGLRTTSKNINSYVESLCVNVYSDLDFDHGESLGSMMRTLQYQPSVY